jgi:drug/metabolite transporter (DMT)-like permease
VLVSVAAMMWGLDGLIRKPLSESTSPYTIVFGEHVVLVALTATLLVPAFRALYRAGPRYVAAGVFVGAGASAIATILFTKALFHGDFITVVSQKVQPLVAVLGAWLVLKEQPRAGFAWFLLPALAGIWLIALPQPLDPHAQGLVPIVETLAAAVLWGLGTVFGRYLSRRLQFDHVSTVRFGFGLIASACALPIVGAAAFSNLHDSFGSPCSRWSPACLRSASTTTACGEPPRCWRRSASSPSRSPPRSSGSTSSTRRCAGRSGSAWPSRSR